ncbi:MAG TPA: crotonase/enoyl-CoA hydratase family protein [Burkholderiaceae bacterium]|nr:crotonase/enoyl-CoA hydratase family protein [Burkholderiaceae bacterium]HQZ04462.1 crotonase/enoyl-CoA hydratase family protein [Burkholderiaceae bacterium]HRA62456.1 crotonase/enoyl-CoA hydratase family protein [Burkholderiaceae bacterium]
MPQYSSLTAELMPGAPGVGRILLNRPDKLNAISEEMPEEIRAAVGWMETQNDVHVILIEGAGRAFCAGYDMDLYANDRKDHPCKQENEPWDPLVDYAFMKRNTENLMSLWRTSKPTIAKVHGYAVGGGSDIALSCDLLVMSDDARIGYMPTRVWGCPTTAMWTFRLGPARAKEMMFTGDTIDGVQAAAWGLANKSVPAGQLDETALALARRIAGVPKSHLAMHKMVVNQVMLTAGLEQTQMMATIFDGITRHNPEGMWFRRYSQVHGFKKAVEWRDSGRHIPEGEEARQLIAELARQIASQ